MTLKAFTGGPQQAQGKGVPSHGQCRAAETNTSFCKASLQVVRTRSHKHGAWPQITHRRGKQGENYSKACIIYTYVFKEEKNPQNKEVSHLPFGLRKTKDSKNRRNKKGFECSKYYCVDECGYYSRTFSRFFRCCLRSWYNARFLTIQILNEETWRKLDI